MKTKTIEEMVAGLRYDYEQISLPFPVLENGVKKIAFFTYDLHIVNDETWEFKKIFRKFVFDLETASFEITEVDSDSSRMVTFDNFYEAEDLDSVYDAYYDDLDAYMEGKIDEKKLKASQAKLSCADYDAIFKEFGSILEDEIEETASNEGQVSTL